MSPPCLRTAPVVTYTGVSNVVDRLITDYRKPFASGQGQTTVIPGCPDILAKFRFVCPCPPIRTRQWRLTILTASCSWTPAALLRSGFSENRAVHWRAASAGRSLTRWWKKDLVVNLDWNDLGQSKLKWNGHWYRNFHATFTLAGINRVNNSLARIPHKISVAKAEGRGENMIKLSINPRMNRRNRTAITWLKMPSGPWLLEEKAFQFAGSHQTAEIFAAVVYV